MAKAKLHSLKLSDLQILAITKAEPAPAKDGDILDGLLRRAFNEVQSQANEIAQSSILSDDSAIAPADEFDNPPAKEAEKVSTNGNGAVSVEAKKEGETKVKGQKFTPSID